MITLDKVITYKFNKHMVRFIKDNADKACIGGRSQIREEDRADSLYEDQLAGQIGNYTGSIHIFGSEEPYHAVRALANSQPNKGDNGQDFIGYNIDMKGSFMRAWKDPTKYRLPVRPKEKHDDWVYVLCMIEKNVVGNPIIIAHLVGWATTLMLPDKPESSGPFDGAFTIPGVSLNPMSTLKSGIRKVQ